MFNGGVEEVSLDEVSTIMIYGETEASFSSKQLDKITRKGTPIIIHRRNLAQPIYIVGGGKADPDDTISAQLIRRRQSRVAAHVSRQLLKAKMRGMSYLVEPKVIPRLAKISKVRNLEAVHAQEYWRNFFNFLGRPEWTRRSRNPASEALDGASKFLAGIILRWVTYHHLSPYHGFLHEPTNYPALVYDLMEPYRGVFEQELLQVFLRSKEKDWMSYGIQTVKELLDDKVYVPLTRQIVTRHELLHGEVISLKYYLLGKQRRFFIPLEGKPNGGRPPKVGFMMYGRRAGRTDFWKVAKEISKQKN